MSRILSWWLAVYFGACALAQADTPLYSFPSSNELTGHLGPVHAVAYSPDNRFIVSGGEDRSLRVWDAATGRQRYVLKPEYHPGYALSWSPDGLFIVFAGPTAFQALPVTEVLAGKATVDAEPLILASNSGYVATLDWSPDQQLLVFGRMKELLVMPAPSLDEKIIAPLTLTHLDYPVTTLAWSPDGQTLATGTPTYLDFTLNLWDATTGEPRKALVGYYVNDLAWSPDGAALLTGGQVVADGGDHVLKIWDPNTGMERGTFAGYTEEVTAVAWSADGRGIVSGEASGQILIRDATSGEITQTFAGHADRINDLAWPPDGNQLVSASGDGTLKIWPLPGEGEPQTLGYNHAISEMALSPNGKWLASVSALDRWVKIRDAATGVEIRSLNRRDEAGAIVAWSPDSRFVLAGSGETLTIWDVVTGEEQRSLALEATPTDAAWSPGGRWIAAAGLLPPEQKYPNGPTTQAGKLTIWDATNGEIHTSRDSRNPFLSWSPDGHFLVAGYQDYGLQISYVATNGLSRTLSDGGDGVAWSPDGRLIATVSDQSFQLFDATTGESWRVLERNFLPTCMVWSRDGRLIASGWNDRVTLWEVETGEVLATFTGHAADVTSVAFSPDGRYLYSSSLDRTIQVWDAAPYTGATQGDPVNPSDCGDAGRCGYLVSIAEPGFYVAQVRLPAGEQEGFWGMQVQTTGGANRGGFHSGALLKENGEAPGFMAFYLAQPEAVTLTPYEYTGTVDAMQIQLSRQEDADHHAIVFGPTLSASAQMHTTDVLEPGFYVAEASSEVGASRGRFGFAVNAQSMIGGVNIGGWIDTFTGGTGEGFGALYLAQPQVVEIQLFFGESYGDLGAGQVQLDFYRQEDDGTRSNITPLF